MKAGGLVAELSPMMRQYFEIKEQNKDTLLFFRVGDFYEMFFDDALLASKELELTLTGKECGKKERAPMCGVPYHSVEAYIARLIEKGYKVAICEQTEDASLAKGIVQREVVRVVTPGTAIESSMLADDRNNYIASIYLEENTAGVCFADVSTGSATATVIQGENMCEQIIAELACYSPCEILFNPAILSYTYITNYIKHNLMAGVELLEDAEYDEAQALKTVREHFGSESDIAQQADKTVAVRALGALINYLHHTQKKGVERLKSLSEYKGAQYMRLSAQARQSMEICETMKARSKKGTLLWVLDKTSTAMGKRLIRTWLSLPLMDVQGINRRLNAVEELYKNNVARLDIAQVLEGVFDMERLLTRIVHGSASPKDVAAMLAACEKLPVISQLMGQFSGGAIASLAQEMDLLCDVRQMISDALSDEVPATVRDGGVIRDGFNSEVDSLRDIMQGGKGVLAGIEAQLKEETGIRTLKIGFNKVFGYYIEVSKTFTHMVPEHFVRKQTLANGERYITEELKQLESRILGASERLTVLEKELFDTLLQEISQHTVRIQRSAQCVAQLDVFCSLAQVAVANGYVRPKVDTSDVIHIKEGRHPVVEEMLSGGLFVPNDAKLDCDENRMQIITGPNMAGKSTYMRQVALIVLMAQMGSFVPAMSCRMGVCDAVFTRVGASDDLGAGRSTFMVEMSEVAEILKYATPKSLVILDEIGRGTSTFDGMSIAQAVVEHIASRDEGPACKTLFATHYHELTELENSVDGVKNYNVVVKKRGDDITFLRRIVRGAADDSYGIQVAVLAGVPKTVTERAKQVLHVLESTQKNANNVTQLSFDSISKMQNTYIPSEMMEKMQAVDPETLTPLEALKLVYELKKALAEDA